MDKAKLDGLGTSSLSDSAADNDMDVGIVAGTGCSDKKRPNGANLSLNLPVNNNSSTRTTESDDIIEQENSGYTETQFDKSPTTPLGSSLDSHGQPLTPEVGLQFPHFPTSRCESLPAAQDTIVPFTPSIDDDDCLIVDEDTLEQGIVQRLTDNITIQKSGETIYAYNELNKVYYSCKIYKNSVVRKALNPYFSLSYDLPFVQLDSIVEVGDHSFALFELPGGGDMHKYIRLKKKIKEDEARRLIKPIFELVAACHESNVVLKDIKLRKCVFLDEARTELVYQGLEEALRLEDGQTDTIHDRVGCPAYVPPEVVAGSGGYSGKAADMWSLGVVLYTMLVGRYPFQNSSSQTLVNKVKKAHYHLPCYLSLQARCLLRALLHVDPASRITSQQALDHGWLATRHKTTPRPVPSGFRSPQPTKHCSNKNSNKGTLQLANEPQSQVPDMWLNASFSAQI